jgi:aspartokinase/homoserine dehydrogenase 1
MNWRKAIRCSSGILSGSFIQKPAQFSICDVTANKVALGYEHLLLKVFPLLLNKIARSSPYSYYRRLKDLSKEFNAAYFLKPMWERAACHRYVE